MTDVLRLGSVSWPFSTQASYPGTRGVVFDQRNVLADETSAKRQYVGSRGKVGTRRGLGSLALQTFHLDVPVLEAMLAEPVVSAHSVPVTPTLVATTKNVPRCVSWGKGQHDSG